MFTRAVEIKWEDDFVGEEVEVVASLRGHTNWL